MKKVLLISVLALGSIATFAQSKKAPVKASGAATATAPAATSTAAPAKGTTISFEKTNYDFGSIPQGTPVEAEFKFTNTGKEPLVLKRVSASCGCTTPYYTQEPVAPGKTGIIKATYNAAATGGFNKPVTVEYNDGSIQLTLSGTVEKAPEASVPENKSTILKK